MTDSVALRACIQRTQPQTLDRNTEIAWQIVKKRNARQSRTYSPKVGSECCIDVPLGFTASGIGGGSSFFLSRISLAFRFFGFFRLPVLNRPARAGKTKTGGEKKKELRTHTLPVLLLLLGFGFDSGKAPEIRFEVETKVHAVFRKSGNREGDRAIRDVLRGAGDRVV